MGYPRGQKVSKITQFSKSDPPEAGNLHRGIVSYQIFDNVTHLGQITNFDPSGTPWAPNRGPKGLKIAYCANNNPQRLHI